MILHVSLNPALDTTYWIGTFNPGETNRVLRQKTVAGGKAVNAAKVLDAIGREVAITGLLGGPSGEELTSKLNHTRIQQHWVKSGKATRTCLNIINQKTGEETELLEAGAAVDKSVWQHFLENLILLLPDCDIVLISGSLPPGITASEFADMLELIKNAGRSFAIDVSGEALLKGSLKQPELVKPNQYELEQFSGRMLYSIDDIVDEALKLQKLGAKRVVVSLGKEGAIAVTQDGVFQALLPEVKAVNTVGSGDAAFACMGLAIAENLSSEDMLIQGMAAGMANALNETAGFVREEDLKEYMKKITVRKWSGRV